MKHLGINIVLLIVLYACTRENDFGKIYSLQTSQTNTLEQFSYGEERLMEMNEMVQDKSSPEEFRSKIDLLYQSFLKIDSLTGIHISEIEKMKIEMFKSFGENLSMKNENSIIHYDYRIEKLSRPISYELSKVKYAGESNLLNEKNKELIILSVKKFRKEICSAVEESVIIENKLNPYFFIDPQINDFKNNEDFLYQYDRKIKKSKIALDDFESIKVIYRILSKSNDQWDKIINKKNSWIDDLSILLSIESDILYARSLAFNLMRCRIGGESYNFTNILPIVYGPSAAIAGDTVELKILMAAYNAYQTPTFEIFGGGKLEKVEKGIGYIKVVLPKSKDIEIKGNITLKNKSGIPKTLMWNHKIVILQEHQ